MGRSSNGITSGIRAIVLTGSHGHYLAEVAYRRDDIHLKITLKP